MTTLAHDQLVAQLHAALSSTATISESHCSRIAQYGAMLLTANRRVNLTGAKDVEALIPHLLDSISVAPYLNESFVDIGSGGGLPAIPLSIISGIPCTMIDAVGKKTKFLQETIEALGLDAVVLNGRAETFAFEEAHREIYNTATARAVAIAPTVLEYLLPFLKIGGKAILQRGALEERERQATADAALVLGGRLIEEVPLEGSHRLLIVVKEHATPIRFPRKSGVPAKRPLCL